MRQIEDRWRIDHKDPPNSSEVYKNIMESFVYNDSQKQDISNYQTYVIKKYLNNKCLKVCMSNSNYANCLSNCYSKLIKSDELFNGCVDEFSQTMENYRLGGKDYFQN